MWMFLMVTHPWKLLWYPFRIRLTCAILHKVYSIDEDRNRSLPFVT